MSDLAQVPVSVEQLLERIRTERSTSPRLVWYGPDHERVELSGFVLDNWAAKTSNLLTEELDAEPGTLVLLDLPPHWRTLVWALAAWRLGCTVAVPAPAVERADAASLLVGAATAAAGAARIIATDRPDQWDAAQREADRLQPGQWDPRRGDTVAAVAMPALALGWSGDLPDGVLDYAAEVRSFGDVYFGGNEDFPAGPAAVALLQAGTGATAPTGTPDAATPATPDPVTFAELVLAPAEPGERTTSGTDTPNVLIRADAPLFTVLREASGVWGDGNAVVLVHPDVAVTDQLMRGELVGRMLP